MANGRRLFDGENRAETVSKRFTVARLDLSRLSDLNVARVAAQNLQHNQRYFIYVNSITHDTGTLYPVFGDSGMQDVHVIQLPQAVRNKFSYVIGATKLIRLIPAPAQTNQRATSVNIIVMASSLQRGLSVNPVILRKILHNHLRRYPLCQGQLLLVPYDDGVVRANLQVKVQQVNGSSVARSPTVLMNSIANMSDTTQIELRIADNCKHIQIIEAAQAFSLPIDFSELGIGGHKAEINQLLREAFYTRLMPPEVLKQYGVEHTRGLLLYGPPGTGKTLIARSIASMFASDKVKVVNAAELKAPLVGQSTMNLRALFVDADDEYKRKGDKSDLHAILFDELDALFQKRGMRVTGSGVGDELVAELLTVLDGVKARPNILIIGMTNRKDLIDEALLRPGRFSTQIEIGLPDLAARLEILEIKTKSMVESGILDRTVNLAQWARRTANYTGAELVGLVYKAAKLALGENVTQQAGQLCVKDQVVLGNVLAKVTQQHFEHAFAEIKPVLGLDKRLTVFDQHPFVAYNHSIQAIEDMFEAHQKSAHQATHGAAYLLHGESGVGKTHAAFHVAKHLGASCVRLVTASDLLALPTMKQYDLLDTIVCDLKRVERSVLILDGMEDLLCADPSQRNYNNTLRIKFQSMLQALQLSAPQCVVIATTNNKGLLDNIGLSNKFSQHVELQKIHLTPSNYISTISTLAKSLAIPLLRSEQCAEFADTDITVRDLINHINRHCALQQNGCLDLRLLMQKIALPVVARESVAPDHNSVFRV